MNQPLSEKVYARLAQYHSLLIEYIEDGIPTISSPQIATRLGVDDSQVRKDFKLLNNEGRGRVGYDVQALKESIEDTLGFQIVKNAVIIGAGHLGMALANYSAFSDYGLNILALFDSAPEKVGTAVNGKPIYPVSRLSEMARESQADIAILTVPRAFAQKVADDLVKADFKYIWNFTPAILKVPDGIKVRNENLVAGFLQFANQD